MGIKSFFRRVRRPLETAEKVAERVAPLDPTGTVDSIEAALEMVLSGSGSPSLSQAQVSQALAKSIDRLGAQFGALYALLILLEKRVHQLEQMAHTEAADEQVH